MNLEEVIKMTEVENALDGKVGKKVKVFAISEDGRSFMIVYKEPGCVYNIHASDLGILEKMHGLEWEMG